MFPIEAQALADEILGGSKFAPGYERTYWDGCVHGYAVRGDMVREFGRRTVPCVHLLLTFIYSCPE